MTTSDAPALPPGPSLLECKSSVGPAPAKNVRDQIAVILTKSPGNEHLAPAQIFCLALEKRKFAETACVRSDEISENGYL
jgi:hypothetical protein